MKHLFILLAMSIGFIHCTKEQDIFLADSWNGIYTTEINSRNTTLDPLVISSSGELTIDGYQIPYTYDVFEDLITFSDVRVNRTVIRRATIRFRQENSRKQFTGEITTDNRGSSGNFSGKTRGR